MFEYPDCVHVAAIDPEDHVVLIQQYRHGYGASTLEISREIIDPADNSHLQVE
jgi:hypothetical protein